MPRVNMRDVAKRAGVSASTVSYIMNNRPLRFSDETRKRVMGAVKEMKYVPNSLARSIFTKSTNAVGLAFNFTAEDVILDPYMSVVFLGVSEAAREYGFDLVLHTSISPDDEIDHLSPLLDNRIDGLLIISPKVGSVVVDFMSENDLPTMVVGSGPAPDVMGHVCVDDVQGARAAVSHLISLGHTRIALARGDVPAPSSLLRELGYKKALADAGIQWDPGLVVQGGFREEGGIAAARAICEMQPLPTAALFSNDRSAFTAIEEFSKKGISVPEDISIVGFDDLMLPGLPSDYLTTMHHPVREIARLSLKLLVKMISGASPTDCRRTLPAELRVRSTTLPPKELRQKQPWRLTPLGEQCERVLSSAGAPTSLSASDTVGASDKNVGPPENVQD